MGESALVFILHIRIRKRHDLQIGFLGGVIYFCGLAVRYHGIGPVVGGGTIGEVEEGIHAECQTDVHLPAHIVVIGNSGAVQPCGLHVQPEVFVILAAGGGEDVHVLQIFVVCGLFAAGYPVGVDIHAHIISGDLFGIRFHVLLVQIRVGVVVFDGCGGCTEFQLGRIGIQGQQVVVAQLAGHHPVVEFCQSRHHGIVIRAGFIKDEVAQICRRVEIFKAGGGDGSRGSGVKIPGRVIVPQNLHTVLGRCIQCRLKRTLPFYVTGGDHQVQSCIGEGFDILFINGPGKVGPATDADLFFGVNIRGQDRLIQYPQHQTAHQRSKLSAAYGVVRLQLTVCYRQDAGTAGQLSSIGQSTVGGIIGGIRIGRCAQQIQIGADHFRRFRHGDGILRILGRKEGVIHGQEQRILQSGGKLPAGNGFHSAVFVCENASQDTEHGFLLVHKIREDKVLRVSYSCHTIGTGHLSHVGQETNGILIADWQNGLFSVHFYIRQICQLVFTRIVRIGRQILSSYIFRIQNSLGNKHLGHPLPEGHSGGFRFGFFSFFQKCLRFLVGFEESDSVHPDYRAFIPLSAVDGVDAEGGDGVFPEGIAGHGLDHICPGVAGVHIKEGQPIVVERRVIGGGNKEYTSVQCTFGFVPVGNIFVFLCGKLFILPEIAGENGVVTGGGHFHSTEFVGNFCLGTDPDTGIFRIGENIGVGRVISGFFRRRCGFGFRFGFDNRFVFRQYRFFRICSVTAGQTKQQQCQQNIFDFFHGMESPLVPRISRILSIFVVKVPSVCRSITRPPRISCR